MRGNTDDYRTEIIVNPLIRLIPVQTKGEEEVKPQCRISWM